MKRLFAVSMIAILVLSASLAFAQGGRQGGRGGMRMMGMGRGSSMFLLMNQSVQEEIKLSADQKTKIQEVMQSGMQAFGRRSEGERPSPEEMQKAMEEQQKKIDAILTADQQKRLKEISIQRQGARAVLDPEVQKELGLSNDQKSKIAKLQEQQQAANRALFDKQQAGGDRQAIRESMQKNREALDAELKKVLTEAQQKKLTEMGGKPFEMQGGFGGRRGGGEGGRQRGGRGGGQ